MNKKPHRNQLILTFSPHQEAVTLAGEAVTGYPFLQHRMQSLAVLMAHRQAQNHSSHCMLNHYKYGLMEGETMPGCIHQTDLQVVARMSVGPTQVGEFHGLVEGLKLSAAERTVSQASYAGLAVDW